MYYRNHKRVVLLVLYMKVAWPAAGHSMTPIFIREIARLHNYTLMYITIRSYEFPKPSAYYMLFITVWVNDLEVFAIVNKHSTHT